ncbi:TPA: hypothetical protein EYG96_01020 [Candidatus Gracilibacteria bacterium]|nr:hypothetical protein [Candidatus Gracilibacteria bacterium]HIQ57703.1 hypothetical protein [Candidatus Gracilibacteria bacterium]
MESYSGGNSRRRHVSKRDLQNLKKGGIKAKKINAKSNAHHENIEIPEAEKALAENIKIAFDTNNIPNNTSQNLNNLKTNISYSQKNFFQKIIQSIMNRIFKKK